MTIPKQDLTSDTRGAGRTTVLVVEDSAHVAKAITLVLTQNGMNVMGPAATLIEARRLLATGRPDAALIDVNLEGETTWPLVADLREKQIDVVVMSGLPPGSPSKFSRLTYLQKPFNADELISALSPSKRTES